MVIHIDRKISTLSGERLIVEIPKPIRDNFKSGDPVVIEIHSKDDNSPKLSIILKDKE